VLDGEVTFQGDRATRFRAAGSSIAAFPSPPTTRCSQHHPFRFPVAMNYFPWRLWWSKGISFTIHQEWTWLSL